MYLLMLLLMLMTSVVQAADVTLTWNPNTESDLAGYKIYQSTISGQYSAPVATVGKVTSQTLTLPQLDIATTYYFAITAYDLAGNESGKSAEVSKLIIGIPTKVAPGAPVLTVASITPTGFDVSWPPVSDGAGGIAKVDVRVGLPTDHWGIMVSQPCAASPCRISGLANGTAYQVQAVAYRAEVGTNVFGPLSTPVPVTTTMPDLPPTPPTGLQVTVNTAEKVVIVASAKDCRRVLTSTAGTTSTQQVRTVSCVK